MIRLWIRELKSLAPGKVAAAVIICVCTFAAAALPEPSSQPATPTSQPATAPTLAAPADFSTPKAAAATLFTAVSHGDRDVIAAALYAADAPQRALADAMADLIVSGKHLGDAAHQRFGDAGDAIGRGMLDPADLQRLDAATVKESGDTATLEVPGQSRPMPFRRQDGKWRLVVTNFGGATPDNIERQTHLVKMMAEAMEESSREIAANKYPKPDAAVDAITKRLHEVMLTFNRPATTRTTAPTQP